MRECNGTTFNQHTPNPPDAFGTEVKFGGDYGDYNCESPLLTGPEFGCIHWEQR